MNDGLFFPKFNCLKYYYSYCTSFPKQDHGKNICAAQIKNMEC